MSPLSLVETYNLKTGAWAKATKTFGEHSHGGMWPVFITELLARPVMPMRYFGAHVARYRSRPHMPAVIRRVSTRRFVCEPALNVAWFIVHDHH